MASCRSHTSPIIVPLTPDVSLESALRDLNKRLRQWGFEDDRVIFSARLDEERERAATDVNTMQAWVHEREDWIMTADRILDRVELLLSSGALEVLEPETLRQTWASLTSVVFKVQYMVAHVEVRLDQWQTQS
ncbi:hypothetical protein PYCCODRAFT_1372579 [Trametes coccinea BRFM310]|uniref:Uncharacterized protein n=1 Tax=Trametes coccinea (strain BRFM310) TaxID=1353009 RepID=A0A1Y2IIG9_TRAC3|nr:hypothetical protein PYCCODRAFT_1372579 [Trametes coccinea BRFM310]